MHFEWLFPSDQHLSKEANHNKIPGDKWDPNCPTQCAPLAPASGIRHFSFSSIEESKTGTITLVKDKKVNLGDIA